jgi:hypothetical protein
VAAEGNIPPSFFHRRFTFLNAKLDYRRDELLAKDVMTLNPMAISSTGWTVDALGEFSSPSQVPPVVLN